MTCTPAARKNRSAMSGLTASPLATLGINTEFPVDIPEDEYYIKIYISYRLSLSDDWTEYEVEDPWFGPTAGVSYELMSSRVVVLKSVLQSAGQVIQRQDILNLYNQYTDDWSGP